MKKHYLLALAAAPLLFACSPEAGNTGPESDSEQSAQGDTADADLQNVLNAELRKDDMKRDQFRHPAETLAFFAVKPDMAIGEYAPGGGWYTRILLPYVNGKGKYVALGISPDNTSFDAEGKEKMAAFGATFPKDAAAMTGIDAANITAYNVLAAPEEAKGSLDRILVFRMMHNLIRWGIADSEIEAMKALLKDDGMIGIVQHRANEDAPADMADGNKGYIKQSDLVALMEKHGFELAAESEVNANAKDTKDYAKGVWTLPPSYAEGDVDHDKYEAIGESDRMTVVFRKKAAE